MNRTTMFLSGMFVGGTTLVTLSTFAFRGEPGVENPNPTNQERHEKIEKMFENKDYESFKELFETRGPARIIDNEEKFNKFIDLKKARENNNTEKAEKLAEELGLGQKMQNGNKIQRGRKGVGKGIGMKKGNEEIKSIFENRNYKKFQELFTGRGLTQIIDNEEKFNKFINLKEARENGNTEKAESLADELGLGQRIKNHHKSIHKKRSDIYKGCYDNSKKRK